MRRSKPLMITRTLVTISGPVTPPPPPPPPNPKPLILLGPPEIYCSKLQTQPSASQTSSNTSSASDPFMDLMVSNFNSTVVKQTPYPPYMGYTENMSPTFLSTGNPCLDFFFHIVPHTPPAILTERLNKAWDHDALTTLKLICNLRGVRGTGKSDKEGFYTAALWLHKHHPKTLACNVGSMADFGYYKDLLEILFRLLEGDDARQKKRKLPWSRIFDPTKREKSKATREVRILAELKRVELQKEKARKQREERRLSMAKNAVERYGGDPDYRLLYDHISDLFSDHLKLDVKFLRDGDLKKITLAAKWCPSLYSTFDRSTLLCEGIAKRVFARESYPEYEGVEEAHYAYRVRDRLRKEVLVPLRKALQLPEIYMSANDWGSIAYNRVASVAMKNYKETFLKHDKLRFEEFLGKVRAGKARIAAGALLPHMIIASLNDGDGGEVAELQWKRMVDDLSNKGKLKNCLAICDVSGSMTGIPMEVSVALGVLVSELSEEPWKGKLITFSENPELQLVEGQDLKSKTDFVRKMEWQMNTDFQKVFDLILQVAVVGNLREEEMIKRVFVFSDMEFDQASLNPWETDYEAIVRKFTEKGYGSVVPEIVFWNLRDSRATPVPSNQQGVALVSGFSKNLLKLFLKDSEELNPEFVMDAAISGDEYKKLVVLD